MFDFLLPPSAFFIIVLTFFVIGGVGALFLKEHDELCSIWAHVLALFGSVLALILALSSLFSGNITRFHWPTPLALFPIAFKIDSLSAFFLALVSIIAIACSIYGLGYMREFYGRYNLGLYGFFYNIFIASLMMVVTASNGFYFLSVWELMALSSYFLVIFEHDKAENIKAGFIYFLITHVGTACLALALFLLYRGFGTLDFEMFKGFAQTLPAGAANAIFILAMLGLGMKAGIVPLHIWLPLAHPAAPSPVSALMSGVMIKTAIYLIIRIFVELAVSTPLWWGAAVLLAGAVSSLLGVLYALSEHDIKRLLAFHSVENIGIILLGIGSALIFNSLGFPALAALGIISALFHTMNHGIFKALLFLGAGSVVSATHTRNLEEYGGLSHRMPATAFFFLIGAMSISALPPLNGFISEWLTFQGLFAGIGSSELLIKFLFILSAAALVLSGGLAAACFVKAYGAAFLGRARSHESQDARETGALFQIPMGLLAGLCVLLGVGAVFVMPILGGIAGEIGLNESALSVHNGFVDVGGGFSLLNPAGLFTVLLGAFLVCAALVWLLARRQKVKTGLTWDCGARLTPRMEITATGFSRSIMMIFKGILKPTKQADIAYRDASMRYFTQSRSISLTFSDIYNVYIYGPLTQMLIFLSGQIKRIQSGNVNGYLLYVFVTLIGVLIWQLY
ncbi:MAG: hydrogenase 4 subunit B [Parcubacteria group bacterium]|nr:hydrogenase 4 subunit B [Parcubacteria group bacterium]